MSAISNADSSSRQVQDEKKSEATPPVRKGRPRPLTERRREQNRRAQQIHRQKQKQSRLNQHLAQETDAFSEENEVTSSVNDVGIIGTSTNGLRDGISGNESTPIAQAFNPNSINVKDGISHVKSGIDNRNFFPLSAEMWNHSLTSTIFTSVCSGISSAIPTHNDSSGGSSDILDSQTVETWLPKPQSGTSFNPAEGLPESTSASGISLEDYDSLQPASPRQALSRNSSYLAENPCYDELTNMFLQNRLSYEDIILAGLEAISRRHDRASSAVNSPSTFFTAFVPSPVQTHISLRRIALTAACLANAAHIGIDVKEEMTGRKQSSGTPSPFFSPSLSGMPLSPSTIVASYRAIKPDLRPCAAQITQQHPLYIDVFPIPSFRQRILALRSCVTNSLDSVGAEVFDEEDFIRDLDNDGMVCWGADSEVGTGTPWDRRSWECRPWFLKKWWMLTGGVDGEMGRQSRWWAEMRGEVFET